MSTSLGHDLTRRDRADQPRCPMERLADRMNDFPKPKGLIVWAYRAPSGALEFGLSGSFQTPDQIEDLINYLARVKG